MKIEQKVTKMLLDNEKYTLELIFERVEPKIIKEVIEVLNYVFAEKNQDEYSKQVITALDKALMEIKDWNEYNTTATNG